MDHLFTARICFHIIQQEVKEHNPKHIKVSLNKKNKQTCCFDKWLAPVLGSWC